MWSWRVLPAVFWKLALQQTAQQVGHGHALREGRHLDACPHGSRDVEGQASGVDVALVERIRVALANPRLGVWISGRTRTDANPLGWAFAVGWIAAGAHDGHRSTSSTSAVISCAAALSGAASRAHAPAATLSAKTTRRRTSLRTAGNGCSVRAFLASRPFTVVLTRR